MLFELAFLAVETALYRLMYVYWWSLSTSFRFDYGVWRVCVGGQESARLVFGSSDDGALALSTDLLSRLTSVLEHPRRDQLVASQWRSGWHAQISGVWFGRRSRSLCKCCSEEPRYRSSQCPQPGGIVLSEIQQLVLKNLSYFYLRVPSCRALNPVRFG